MPIGTNRTAVLLQTNKIKITRLSKTKQEQSFWKLLLETIIVSAIATIAAPITGGLSVDVAIALEASDFAIGAASFTTRALTEFVIQQLYDSYNNQVTTISTILNLLLPASANINEITRGYRLAKVLKLSKSTKVLEKLELVEAKNFDQLINNLNGKKILTTKINGKRQLFDFTKPQNRESILQNLGFVTQQNFKFNFKNLSTTELKDSLLLQANLTKLSPKLIPSLKIKDIEAVNNFLTKFDTNLETVLQFSQKEWLDFVSLLQKTNSGKSLVLTLQQIRTTTIKFNFKNKFISNSLQKINSSFKYFNFNFYIDKAINKFWENTSYFAKLKEKIVLLQEKIENLESKLWSKLEKLKLKSKETLHIAEKETMQKFQLIPLISPVFAACKIQPITLTECIITIFHTDNRYDPIVITDTLVKAETFVTQIHPFHWYRWKSGWYLGYGITKNKVKNILNLAPTVIKQAVQEAFRIKYEFEKLHQKYDVLKNKFKHSHNFEKSLFTGFNFKNINKTLVTSPINFAVTTIFNNKTTKPLTNLVNANIFINNKTTKKSKKNKYNKKIKKVVNKNVPKIITSNLEKQVHKKW